MRSYLTVILFTLAAPMGLCQSPHFRNATKEVGLEGVKAKDVVLTDLDGDGRLDLVCDRQRIYLRKDDRFVVHEDHGIPFPEVELIPVADDGKPDREKAKTRAYVPHYLYFADLDNDGDQDAVWGVHSKWEWGDMQGNWKVIEECDPGLRTQVLLNDGEGAFAAAPPSALSADENCGPAMALAMVDVNGDGVLDLYEGREYRRYGRLDNCGVDRLWRGDGKGGFTDVTREAGLWTDPQPAQPKSSRPSYGVTHADIDGDGLQDLLQMAYGRQWNLLWRNRGDGTFEEVGLSSGYAGDDVTHGRYPDWVRRPAEQPFRSNGNTFDCAVGDLDNDGDLDLFLGEIQHAWAGEASDPPSVLVNETVKSEEEEEGVRVKFTRHSVQDLLPPREFRVEDPRRINYGDLHAAWLDYDNDTRLDLLIGSGDYPDGQYLRLYRQKSDGGFEEVTALAGFDWEGCGSLSIGDVNRDGAVDIVAGRSFMRLNQKHRDQFMDGIKVNEVGVFLNQHAATTGNHWLTVTLEGKGAGGANRDGIGARILVTTGDLTQIREIRGGSGLANHQDAFEAHFGLGKAEVVDRLEIRWNDAAQSTTIHERVAVDQRLHVVQR